MVISNLKEIGFLVFHIWNTAWVFPRKTSFSVKLLLIEILFDILSFDSVYYIFIKQFQRPMKNSYVKCLTHPYGYCMHLVHRGKEWRFNWINNLSIGTFGLWVDERNTEDEEVFSVQGLVPLRHSKQV